MLFLCLICKKYDGFLMLLLVVEKLFVKLLSLAFANNFTVIWLMLMFFIMARGKLSNEDKVRRSIQTIRVRGFGVYAISASYLDKTAAHKFCKVSFVFVKARLYVCLLEK